MKSHDSPKVKPVRPVRVGDTRPFDPPEATGAESEGLDLEDAVEGADRLGHSFGRVSLAGDSTKVPVRTQLSLPSADASRIPVGLTPRETIQRQVALAKKTKGKADWVELNSIDYSLKRAGPPVELFLKSEFGDLEGGDSLYVVSHGSPGKAGEIETQDMIRRFHEKPPVGLDEGPDEIVFTSCYSGLSKSGRSDEVDSVVGELHTGLKKKWPGIRIKGARGASGKADVTGDEFTVVDNSKTVDVPGVGSKRAWLVVQYILMAYWEPAEDTDKALLALGNSAGLDQKAAAAAQAVETFYLAWKHAMQDPSGSPTLNALKTGNVTLKPQRLAYLSTKLKAKKELGMKQVVELIKVLQGFSTLTLSKPMTEIPSK